MTRKEPSGLACLKRTFIFLTFRHTKELKCCQHCCHFIKAQTFPSFGSQLKVWQFVMPQHSVSGNWFCYTLIHLIGSYHFAQSWAGSQSVPRHACCSLAQVFAWKTISCWFSHSILTNIYSPLHPFSSPSAGTGAARSRSLKTCHSLGWFKWLLCV